MPTENIPTEETQDHPAEPSWHPTCSPAILGDSVFGYVGRRGCDYRDGARRRHDELQNSDIECIGERVEHFR